MTTTKTIQAQRYSEGLLDPRWKKLRISVLERDGFQCKCCGNRTGLHVHHKQYHRMKITGEWKHPWEYDIRFLVTLCDTCHAEGHKQFAIPIKEI